MLLRVASLITTEDVINPYDGTVLIHKGTQLTTNLMYWLKDSGVVYIATKTELR